MNVITIFWMHWDLCWFFALIICHVRGSSMTLRRPKWVLLHAWNHSSLEKQPITLKKKMFDWFCHLQDLTSQIKT